MARDPQFDLSIWWPAHAAEFAGEMAGFRFSLGLPEDRVRLYAGHRPRPRRSGRALGETRLGQGRRGARLVPLYAELVVLGLGHQCVILDNPELANAVVQRCREGLAAHEELP